jgi:DNA-binding transcriptional MerR regulator
VTTDLATTSQAAELLNVPAARISAWRHRGLVTPIGLIPGRSGQGKGVALYDLEQLRPLADQYHARHANKAAP